MPLIIGDTVPRTVRREEVETWVRVRIVHEYQNQSFVYMEASYVGRSRFANRVWYSMSLLGQGLYLGQPQRRDKHARRRGLEYRYKYRRHARPARLANGHGEDVHACTSHASKGGKRSS